MLYGKAQFILYLDLVNMGNEQPKKVGRANKNQI